MRHYHSDDMTPKHSDDVILGDHKRTTSLFEELPHTMAKFIKAGNARNYRIQSHGHWWS